MRSRDFLRLLLVFGSTVGLAALAEFAGRHAKVPDWVFFVLCLGVPYWGYCMTALLIPGVQRLIVWQRHLVAQITGVILTGLTFVVLSIWALFMSADKM
jgi:hypothetical protein